jgi:hypothetical protein
MFKIFESFDIREEIVTEGKLGVKYSYKVKRFKFAV